MRVVLDFNDRDVGEIVVTSLRAEGFDAELATSPAEARISILSRSADVVVVDWTLPELTGIELCGRLRNTAGRCLTPILILGQSGQNCDHICCQPDGVEHVLAKPYSIKDLSLRIRSLAIGANVSAVATAELRADALVMDLRSRGVTHGLRRLHLGPTEFHLLEIFMENRGCVISRAQLMSAIWGRAAPVHERTVDVHIARLRRVISTGATQSPIRTVRGYGYVFDIIDVV